MEINGITFVEMLATGMEKIVTMEEQMIEATSDTIFHSDWFLEPKNRQKSAEKRLETACKNANKTCMEIVPLLMGIIANGDENPEEVEMINSFFSEGISILVNWEKEILTAAEKMIMKKAYSPCDTIERDTMHIVNMQHEVLVFRFVQKLISTLFNKRDMEEPMDQEEADNVQAIYEACEGKISALQNAIASAINSDATQSIEKLQTTMKKYRPFEDVYSNCVIDNSKFSGAFMYR